MWGKQSVGALLPRIFSMEANVPQCRRSCNRKWPGSSSLHQDHINKSPFARNELAVLSYPNANAVSWQRGGDARRLK